MAIAMNSNATPNRLFTAAAIFTASRLTSAQITISGIAQRRISPCVVSSTPNQLAMITDSPVASAATAAMWARISHQPTCHPSRTSASRLMIW
jgi:hypothetical protein